MIYKWGISSSQNEAQYATWWDKTAKMQNWYVCNVALVCGIKVGFIIYAEYQNKQL